MATQQPTKTVILSGTFTSGPSGLVPAAPTQFIEDLPIPFGYTPDNGKVKLSILLGIVIPVLGFTLVWLFFKTIQLRVHWKTEKMRKEDARSAIWSPQTEGGSSGQAQAQQLDVVPVSREEQQELAATGRCPEGWQWVREGDGYRCKPDNGTGTHTMSAAELRRSRQ